MCQDDKVQTCALCGATRETEVALYTICKNCEFSLLASCPEPTRLLPFMKGALHAVFYAGFLNQVICRFCPEDLLCHHRRHVLAQRALADCKSLNSIMMKKDYSIEDSKLIVLGAHAALERVDKKLAGKFMATDGGA